MEHEKGYVFDLMEQGGPTDVREPYFKEAVDEILSGSGGTERMTDEEKVKDVYRRYWDGMIRKDTDLLRSLMSDDYCLEHMTGVRQSKETFLAGLTGGIFNYYSANHDSIEARINGSNAVMTGKSRVLAAVYGGGKRSWRLQGEFTLRKENGEWRLTSYIASTY